MKYKEGDKVRIKSLDWYNENKDEYGYVRLGDYLFTPDLAKYCGEEFTISHTTQFTLPTYVMIGNGHEWSDEMIEGLVGEDFYMEDDELEVEKDDIVWNLGDGKFRVFLPDGYEFIDENGNVINATKIVLEKKKSKYPKSYEECCKVLNYCCNPSSVKTTHREELIRKFQFLLLARDAYWKIAGEEMGLDKPWNPDWENIESTKYVICGYREEIRKDISYYIHFILAFPTAEMRDAFYEYFKDLIEECKELL